MQKYFLVLVMSIFLFACGETVENEDKAAFEINATISGAEGQMAFLREYKDGEMQTLDSIAIDSLSEFSFTGTVEAPSVKFLFIETQRIEVFIENSKITLVGSLEDLANIEITGSQAQNELNAFKDASSSFKVRMDTLYAEYGRASKAKDEVKLEELNTVYDSLSSEKSAFILEHIKQNNKSFASPYIIRRELVHTLKFEELKEIVAVLDSSLAKSEYYIYLADRVEILSNVAIGEDFVDFTQNDTLDQPFTLSSLKGNVILIDFWASWCGPCRRANPGVVEIYNEFHEKGFEILGVSFDKGKEEWLKAIKDDKLTWYHVSDLQFWNNAAGKLYAVNSIPHTVLIDKKGKIVAKNMTKEELHELVAKLVAE